MIDRHVSAQGGGEHLWHARYTFEILLTASDNYEVFLVLCVCVCVCVCSLLCDSLYAEHHELEQARVKRARANVEDV